MSERTGILAITGDDPTLRFYLQRSGHQVVLLDDLDALIAALPEEGPAGLVFRTAAIGHEEDRLFGLFERRPDLRSRTVLVGEHRGLDLGVPIRLPDPPTYSVLEQTLATLTAAAAPVGGVDPVREPDLLGQRMLIAATRFVQLEGDRQRLLGFGLEMLCEFLHCDSGVVLEWSETRQDVRLAARSGQFLSSGEGAPPEPLRDIAYQVVARRGPVREMAHGMPPGTGEVLGLPLLDRRRVPRGVVLVAAGDRGRFEDAALKVAQLLVDALAASLLNATRLEQSDQLAVIDPLTGLYNRRFFDRTVDVELQRAVRMKRPVTLGLLDIDHFKRINDRLGYADGDRVIRAVAAMLRDNFREVDYVIRWGGDEFAVLLPETGTTVEPEVGADPTIALFERVAEEVRSADFSQEIPGLELPVTMSIGVATFPNHASDGQQLFTEANSALREAKERGRDQVAVARPDNQRFSARSDQ